MDRVMGFVKRFVPFSVIGVVLFLSCYAKPIADDLERVKRQFLVLRFHAPFSETYKGLSDRELFELSCQKNRVRTDDVLALLEESDPGFYSRLNE